MDTRGSFTLTASEVSKRKEYLEITLEDERRLREANVYLEGHLQTIIDHLYEYLLGHEHTRQWLSAPGLVVRLKGLQAKYFG